MVFISIDKANVFISTASSYLNENLEWISNVTPTSTNNQSILWTIECDKDAINKTSCPNGLVSPTIYGNVNPNPTTTCQTLCTIQNVNNQKYISVGTHDSVTTESSGYCINVNYTSTTCKPQDTECTLPSIQMGPSCWNIDITNYSTISFKNNNYYLCENKGSTFLNKTPSTSSDNCSFNLTYFNQ